MEEPLYRRVIAMKAGRTWAVMMKDIVDMRDNIRSYMGKRHDMPQQMPDLIE